MLHVFLVDNGIMLKFEMDIAAKTVLQLMEAIQQRILVPPHKQVLLSSHGETLAPDKVVASYISSGTEDMPYFLFSRTSIESVIPPSPAINTALESSLQEEHDKCVRLNPSYDTLVTRAKLAMEYQKRAQEFAEMSECLVKDQILQKDGWIAALTNLEQIVSAFENHLTMIEQYYRNFISVQSNYKDMLLSFNHILVYLNQTPLLPCLYPSENDEPISLLQWISSHDQQSSLENLLHQCTNALHQNYTPVEETFNEARKQLESAHNAGMSEIRGLSERLVSLQNRVHIIKKLMQDQVDMAQGFQQNRLRAQHIGDPSILPDLCASHQKQLHVLFSNHKLIREHTKTCSKSKDELSANLQVRLRWVKQVERAICECDSKLLVYHESIKRIKKRLDIFEQICEAPRMYGLAVLEVLRRKNFSVQFTEWCQTISRSSTTARSEELEKRQNFEKVFGKHFVKNLFPGLDEVPKPFAEHLPELCDMHLPNISIDDIKLLQRRAPDLMRELNLNDPLETSTVLRACLSQSNLTKLIDPNQNKALEDTMNLRQNVDIDQDQLTMSVLKREISFSTEEPFPLINTRFNGNTSASTDGEEDDYFQPSSLRSLSREKQLVTSSDSDALFHSAELDFSQVQDDVPCHSGKSNSSPIPIKLTDEMVEYPDSPCLSHSSPVSRSVKAAVVLSPDLCKEYVSRMLDLSPSVDRSPLNSSRSLSDAIRSSEVAKNIHDAPSLVLAIKKQLQLLKLENGNDKLNILDLKSSYCASVDKLQTMLIEFLREKTNEITNNCENCKTLQTENEKSAASYTKKISVLTIQSKGLTALNEELEDKQTNLQKECDEILFKLNSSQSVHDNLILTTTENEKHLKSQLKENMQHLNETKKLYSETLQDSSIVKKQVVKLNEEKKSLEEEIDTVRVQHRNDIESLEMMITKQQNEINELQLEIKKMNEAHQKSNDQHLEQVSSLNIQCKDLKKIISEKEREVSILNQDKDAVEVRNQTKFNTVFNIIKKEKNDKIRGIESQVNAYEKETTALKHKIDTLLVEIRVHKEGYMTLQAELKRHKLQIVTLEQDILTYKMKNEKLMENNKNLENEMAELKENVEFMKNEKLRVMQELKTHYDEALEKEKSSLLLAIKLEKEEHGKSEHAIKSLKSSSIEEGIDELELERLLVKVKALETKNKLLEEENEKLNSEGLTTQSLDAESPKMQRVQRTTDVQPTDKVSSSEFEVGSLVFVCYDSTVKQYVVLTSGEEKFFLHPESIKSIKKSLGKDSDKREWFFGYVTAKEYCFTKKSNNKFNLPINTCFHRVHIRPSWQEV